MKTEISSTLASRIMAEYVAAYAAVDATKKNMRAAIEHAAACGEYLLEARDIAKAGFLEWAAQAIPQISPAEIKKFIGGAKRVRSQGIDCGPRQLLLFFADEEETAAAPQINRDPAGANWFSELGKIVERVNRALDHKPVDEWTSEERISFKQRLRPIVELYERL
jgi:hypothetical protein